MSEPSAEPGRALVPMDAARGARVGVDDSRRAPKGERRGYSRATFPGLDAGQAVRTLRRLWWLPLLTALLAGTGAVLWVRQQPVSYSSRATLQLVEGRSGLSAGIAGQERRSQSSEVMIGSQLRIVRSRSIAAAVVDSEPLEFRVMPVDFPQSIIADVRLDSAALPARFPVYFAADGWRHDSAETGLTPYGVPGRIGPLRLTFSKPGQWAHEGNDPRRVAIRCRRQVPSATAVVRNREDESDGTTAAGWRPAGCGRRARVTREHVPARGRIDCEAAGAQPSRVHRGAASTDQRTGW